MHTELILMTLSVEHQKTKIHEKSIKLHQNPVTLRACNFLSDRSMKPKESGYNTTQLAVYGLQHQSRGAIWSRFSKFFVAVINLLVVF